MSGKDILCSVSSNKLWRWCSHILDQIEWWSEITVKAPSGQFFFSMFTNAYVHARWEMNDENPVNSCKNSVMKMWFPSSLIQQWRPLTSQPQRSFRTSGLTTAHYLWAWELPCLTQLLFSLPRSDRWAHVTGKTHTLHEQHGPNDGKSVFGRHILEALRRFFRLATYRDALVAWHSPVCVRLRNQRKTLPTAASLSCSFFPGMRKWEHSAIFVFVPNCSSKRRSSSMSISPDLSWI